MVPRSTIVLPGVRTVFLELVATRRSEKRVNKSVALMPRRIKLRPDTDILGLIDEVRADKEPRVLEREGEDVAVLLSPDDYAALTAEPKSKRHKARLLSLAGAWKDLDTDRMVEEIYRARHESPPSRPVKF